MDVQAPSMTEKQAAAATGALDVEFAALVAEHHADLVRLAYAMVGDPDLANDVAQAAWTAAWRQRRGLRDQDKRRGWLFTITANEARRALRRRRVRQMVPLGGGEGLETRRPDREGELDLVDALQRLPIRDREILARRYALGQTSAEIGNEVGMSDSGVRVRIGRLLTALREELGR